MGMRVRVLSVARGLDPVTGRPIYAVTFGVLTPITDVIRDRLVAGGQQVPPVATETGVNKLILFYEFPEDRPVPYRIASEWNLEVSGDGQISAREVVSP